MAKKAGINDFEVTETSNFINPSQFLAGGEEEQVTDVPEEQEEEEAELPEEEQEVVVTAPEEQEEEEEEEAGDDEFSFAPIAADLIEEGAWELPEGKKLEDYDDDLEGMREMAKDASHVQLLKTVATLPDTAQRIMQLALKGATDEDLQALLTIADGPDWEEADLEDEDVQKAVAEEAMRLRDPELTDEDIEEAIQDLIDIGKLDKQAAKDQRYLVKMQEAEKSKLEAVVEQRNAEAQKAYEGEVTFVRNFIAEAKEIGGLTITKKDREDFMKYLTEKDKDGLTQADKANTRERRIQKEFLNFKNFNLGKLKREAVTEATKEIKKQIGRYNSAKRPTNSGNRPDAEDGFAGKIMSPGQFLAAMDN